ncbi:TPA: hypothetical protein P0E12_004976 [Vibrio harveyi]|nr:hypothetical protein [Vibrio harveyi]
MKFGTIEKGDRVFVRVLVNWGAGWIKKQQHFFIPIKVDSVSSTRFKAAGRIFLKSDGSQRGNPYCPTKARETTGSTSRLIAYQLGDKIPSANFKRGHEIEVMDQTPDYFDAKRKQGLTKAIEQLLINYEFDPRKWTSEELGEFLLQLEEKQTPTKERT